MAVRHAGVGASSSRSSGRGAVDRVARCWKQARMLYGVLLLIRFSLLLGLIGALILLFNDQAQDVLHGASADGCAQAIATPQRAQASSNRLVEHELDLRA